MKSIEEIYSLFLNTPKVFTDSRQAANGGIFFALKGDNFDGNDFAVKTIADGADYAVVDRKELDRSEKIIYVENVLSTLQKLANYHRRQLKTPILAITGTNGKTTTKELIASVLQTKYNIIATQGNLNNHIGVPLTLLTLTKKHEIGVIEMGANHPGEIEFLCSIAEPDLGIITNVGKAHIEGFGSFEGVKKTKGELYTYLASNGKGIFINADNEHLMGMAPVSVEKYTYGINSESVQLKGEVANADLLLVCRALFPKGWLYLKTNLTGAYNLENILAAARIGLYFNIDPLLIQKGIETYAPSNSRSQLLRKGENTILMDCYNANPSSMEVSLKNFMQIEKEGKVFILGDMLELGSVSIEEHQKIVDVLSGAEDSEVFLVGDNFMQTISPSRFFKCLNVDQLRLEIENKNWKNRFLLIKGSRGIKLEKIIESI
jgi:UDP-N-acetylmuramoyl-tripeptide--D-alanyl-D-alanine ligase